MSEPRELSIEELRRLAPAERARYLGELARASLERAMRGFESEEGHPTAPPK